MAFAAGALVAAAGGGADATVGLAGAADAGAGADATAGLAGGADEGAGTVEETGLSRLSALAATAGAWLATCTGGAWYRGSGAASQPSPNNTLEAEISSTTRYNTSDIIWPRNFKTMGRQRPADAAVPPQAGFPRAVFRPRLQSAAPYGRGWHAKRSD